MNPKVKKKYIINSFWYDLLHLSMKSVWMRVLQVQGPVQLHPHHGGHAAHREVRGLLCQAGAEGGQPRAQCEEDLHGQPRHQPLAGGPRVHVRGRRHRPHVLLSARRLQLCHGEAATSPSARRHCQSIVNLSQFCCSGLLKIQFPHRHCLGLSFQPVRLELLGQINSVLDWTSIFITIHSISLLPRELQRIENILNSCIASIIVKIIIMEHFINFHLKLVRNFLTVSNCLLFNYRFALATLGHFCF